MLVDYCKQYKGGDLTESNVKEEYEKSDMSCIAIILH